MFEQPWRSFTIRGGKHRPDVLVSHRKVVDKTGLVDEQVTMECPVKLEQPEGANLYEFNNTPRRRK